MLITKDPGIAHYAERAGVDRIFVDMETIGKSERQGHLDTHKAAHTLDDVRNLRRAVSHAELMVRVNPLHADTQLEVDQVISAGADRVMLPMFQCRIDVEQFASIIAGRVPISYLAETPLSVLRLPEWVPLLDCRDQVHFGLNDLSIALGARFLFEPLAARMFDYAGDVLERRGLDFGIGGIARPEGGELPASWVLGEHVRLKASWVILSRAFHGGAANLSELNSRLDMAAEITSLREIESMWKRSSDADLVENHQRLEQRVFQIARQLEGNNQ